MSNEIQKYNFFGFVSNWLFVLVLFGSLSYGYSLFQQKADFRVQERARAAIAVRIAQEQASIAKEKADAARIAKAKRQAKEKADAARIAKANSSLTKKKSTSTTKKKSTSTTKKKSTSTTKKKSWNWDNTNNKHLLIQFVNAYYNENNSPYLSDDALHVKIVGFFNGNLKKTKNAKGWESFRLNRDRKAAGISVKRFKEIKKDLRNKEYDDIIEDHIYRTEKGQELWMLLRFPYIRKN